MKESKCILLFREDLKKGHEKEKFEDISYFDFKFGSVRPVAEADFIAFCDNDYRTKILKNRYGNNGVVK